MMTKPILVLALALVPALGLMASQRSSGADSVRASATSHAAVDYDHDGRVDFFTVDPSGRGRLLIRLPDGSFEDRTEVAGLGAVGAVDKAFFKDLANDRWADLVVVRPDGRLGLFSGFEGAFTDRTDALAGRIAGAVTALEFDDYDLNGWFDLGLWLADGETTLLLNRGGLRFERSAGDGTGRLGAAPSPGRLQLAPGAPGGAGSTAPVGPGVCADQLIDQSNGSCLDASSVPALGRLYPLSSDLFVANTSGFVGVNTTTPTSHLDVDGTLRVRSSGGITLDSGSFGIVFPDGSVQNTATVAGQQGPQGDPGPEGAAGTTLPAGTILMSGAASAPPGFLLCDGSLFDENLYPELAAAIGMAYGGGTTFRVPDLTQRFPMGADGTPGVTLGESGGSLSHTHTVPGHQHGRGTLGMGGDGGHTHAIGNLTVTGDGGHAHTASASTELTDGTVGLRFVERAVVSSGGAIRRMFGFANTGVNIQYFTGDGQPAVTNTTHSHVITLAGFGTHSHDVGGSISTESDHTHTLSGAIGDTSGPSGDALLTSGSNSAGASVDRNPPFVTVHYIIKT